MHTRALTCENLCQERGLCKIRRYNPDILRPKTMVAYFDASARLAQAHTHTRTHARTHAHTHTHTHTCTHIRMNACSQVVAAVSTLAFALLSTEVSSNDKAKVQADAVKVRETLTSMGATFIKVGQVLANRPDIIRADYMDELTKLQVNWPYICPFLSVTDTTRLLYHTTTLSHTTLSHTTPHTHTHHTHTTHSNTPHTHTPCSLTQDKVPPFPSNIAFEIMEAGLGCPPTDIFLDITPQPVAAASLGQVYKARLKSNGKEVAIKVQRPGVAGKFSQKSAPSILTT